MKNKRIIVLALAILNLLLLPVFALVLMVIYNWAPPLEPIERSSFTDEQRDEICNALMLELAPGETLSTYFQPGWGQGKGWLEVTVHGVVSEEDFLSRLYTEADPSENGVYHLFGTEEESGEMACTLFFREGSAEFYIGGRMSRYMPTLVKVMNFLYEDYPRRPFSRPQKDIFSKRNKRERSSFPPCRPLSHRSERCFQRREYSPARFSFSTPVPERAGGPA